MRGTPLRPTAAFLRGLTSALFAVVFLLPSVGAANDVIPIYYASSLMVPARQSAIKKDFEKLGFDPVVLGNFREFKERLQTEKPKVVIAPGVFAKYNPDFCPVLRFSYAGKEKFQYLLVALDDHWKTKDINTIRIGAVQEVSSDQMKDFVSSVSGQRFVVVRPVPTPYDLLPQLKLGSADLVMISPDNLDKVMEKYNVDVKKVGQSLLVEAPTVFVRKDFDKKDVVQRLSQLNLATSQALGFSALQPCGGCEK